MGREPVAHSFIPQTCLLVKLVAQVAGAGTEVFRVRALYLESTASEQSEERRSGIGSVGSPHSPQPWPAQRGAQVHKVSLRVSCVGPK